MKKKEKLLKKKKYYFPDLVAIIGILRSPTGCPWDKKQKVSNYKDYLLEEVYELIEALSKEDEERVREELGDVMLLLVMISQIYKEKKKLDIVEVIDSACRKLIRRHPHVFGTKKVATAHEVISNWTRQKAREKNRNNALERLPKIAPALLRSFILFKELRHLEREEEINKYLNMLPLDAAKISRRKIGIYLLSVSFLAFQKGINSEEALQEAVNRIASGLHYNGPGKNKACK